MGAAHRTPIRQTPASLCAAPASPPGPAIARRCTHQRTHCAFRPSSTSSTLRYPQASGSPCRLTWRIYGKKVQVGPGRHHRRSKYDTVCHHTCRQGRTASLSPISAGARSYVRLYTMRASTATYVPIARAFCPNVPQPFGTAPLPLDCIDNPEVTCRLQVGVLMSGSAEHPRFSGVHTCN